MTGETGLVPVVAPAADDADDLYHRAPCGYLSTDPDGRILQINRTLATWLGWEVTDLLSRAFIDLLTPGGRIFHETHFAPLLRMHGEAREIAVDLRRRDGTRLPVLVNATMDSTPDGSLGTVRIAVFDATERRRYERELVGAKERAEASEERASMLARTLQETLIPPSPPQIADLDVAAAYRPAGDGSEVGGDFYDVFDLGEDDWFVILGDVCGKGAEAAVVTALVRYTVRALAVGTRQPSLLLEKLNEAVIQHRTDRFCTVVLARLQRQGEGWRAVVSVGGHPAPLLLSADTSARQLDLLGPLVGVMDDATYTDHEVLLGPGDTLLLYTDGVTEASGAAGFFGDDRLLRVVDDGAGGTATEVVDTVLTQVLDFQDGIARDDIALLALGVPLP
ncbi:Phosphoserine phosphatase RsbP [Nocardioides dokdonensis FR1436]|uniref:Phosphoserine phosphatase RsbP n=1 Tax=Nocardioides dokdonensis FR1436 TaxID=1300347 RepID=A0A1A9GKM5_9ACTN|nr:SpoIIE family protein phosphatase [Nocardioides dokdonensis]ANH38897.1 Phosphoserine phosphatase RsbP [Nocardioides dokdonensis FR1436]